MSTTHIQRWPVEVSIIIPVFNKADLTEQCLKTLASVNQGVTHEIIVVDNASTDSTPRLLASRPSVRGIRNVENRGFAGACNQGAAAARGQHLLFLNNDTVPFSGWLEALAQEFRQHPAVAVAGAKLLYASGLVQHAGVAFTRETRDPFHPYRCLQSDDPRVNRRREVQAVTAACMLIRREWFERGGRFNEEYRNGYEDLDLCLNIRRLGGLIIYQPKSVLCHLESQTSSRMKFDGVNRALFFTKWSSWLLADEDAYYLADDYRLVYREEEGRRVGRLVRIAGDADRRAWRVVAQVQRLAAEGRWNEVIARLEDPGTWPEDAALRRWAATLCFRLDRPMAGNAHLRASLELEPSAEAVLQLAQHDPARAGDYESCCVAGLPGDESARRFAPADFVVEPPADSEVHATGAGFASRFKGTRLFLAGDYAKAGEAFEHALLQGADSREVVFGMAAAAWKMGDLPVVQQCCDALLAQRNGDPLARRLRQLIDDARTSVSVPTTTKPHAPLRSRSGDPPNQPPVSIITLALNQVAHTRKCLESLAARTVASYEIIAVDNGSQDRTSDLLHAWCGTSPRHIVIRNENNRGFAAGNNQALTVARGEFVVFLNNDTVVTDGWLERMLAVLERHPDTGIVGPMSNRVAGPQRVESPGYPSLEDLPAFAREWARAHDARSREVDRVIGFCLLARREVIERIGGLDERFVSGNFEDDDFCLRARLAGFKIRIAEDAFVHHVGGQTFQGAGIDYREAMTRNWELFKRKWNLPPSLTLEQGYPTPERLAPGEVIQFPLPDLAATHEHDPEHRIWCERSTTASANKGATTGTSPAALARLGSLPATDCNGSRQAPKALWLEGLQALKLRPFHPPAWLLLAQIARGQGAHGLARQCADRAHELAPGWRRPRKFLKTLPQGGGKAPDWMPLPETNGTSSHPTGGRLCVLLIARDEEASLGRCLVSVKEVAHQIIVLDTGSTDRTVEIAREHGAEVHIFEWCDDFAAARNAALEHARGDWVLVLDADEELPPDSVDTLRRELRESRVLAYRLPIVDAGREADGAHYVPRLFRNAPGAFFQGRIHEHAFGSLEPLWREWGLECRLGKTRLLHHGYTAGADTARAKAERNLRLLRLALDEQPDDVNLRMNLGLELTRTGQAEAGLAEYWRAFGLAERQPSVLSPELREALLTQLCTRLLGDGRAAEVPAVIESGLGRQHPLTASLHYLHGLACLELERWDGAVPAFRQCIALRAQPALTPAFAEIHGHAPEQAMACCLTRTGRETEAERILRDLIQRHPESAEAVAALARFLAERDRAVEALEALHAALPQFPGNATLWLVGGEIALGRAEFLEFACDWTGEALRLWPGEGRIIAQRAEALLLRGDTAGALPLWRQALTGEQPDRWAATILCELCAGQLGEHPLNGSGTAVTREFIRWYQRLAQYQAHAPLLAVNARLPELHGVLPLAAQALESALTEASHAP